MKSSGNISGLSSANSMLRLKTRRPSPSGRVVITLEASGPGVTSVTITNTAIGAIPQELPAHTEGWSTMLRQLCERTEQG